MASSQLRSPDSQRVRWSRYALLLLDGLFVFGAFAQFFLVGRSYFESPAHWSDHANLGHVLGLLTYVIWIPAVLGRTGGRVIAGSVALAVLFGLQYAFIESDEPSMQALHPLNGSLLLALSLIILWATYGLVRREARQQTEVRRLVESRQG